MTWDMKRFPATLLIGFSLLGCAKEGLTPISEPASEHPAYAAEYPKRLATATKMAEVEASWAKDFGKEFKRFPEELKEPDWKGVEHVYELALQDGKSAHYAHARRANHDVAAFFVDEKKELVRKISGGVQYQAEQERCDSKFYGAIDRGLEKGVEERFEDREEAASHAARFITQHEKRMGPENAKVLREQSKKIAAAAHLVYVALAERHRELESLVSEKSEVKKTFERRISEIEAGSEGEAPEEKAAREEELAALRSARDDWEKAVSSAERHLEGNEERVEQARSSFESAVDALLRDVRGRAAG